MHALLAGGLLQRGPDVVRLPGGHPDGVHPEGHGLRGEQVEVAPARADRGHAETVGVLLDDLDRLGADGPGGTEEDDVAGRAHVVIVVQAR